ncbi:hypothetical protein HYY75_00665, partial [bacterium]|nr:hypothetical protein [bacterium]
EVEKSGLDLFGAAPLAPPPKAMGGAIETRYLSPTLVYGPVWRIYYRVVTVRKPEIKNIDGNQTLDLPFIGTEPPPDGSPLPIPIGIDRGKKMNATEASMIFGLFKIPQKFLDNFVLNYTTWGLEIF